MNFFRSQTMGYYKLIIPRESAWNVMNELAELDCIHFVDYDPTLPMINRPFANYIKRCDDLLVKLSLIEHEMKKYQKKITYCKDVNFLIKNFKQLIKERSKASHTYLDEIENDIDKKHQQLIEQSTNMENLHERRNKLIEHKSVLLKGEALLGQSFFQPANYVAEGYVNLQGKELDDIKILQGSVKFNYLVGVINKEDQIRFKRIIFRITKGNAWMNTMDIESDQIVDTKNDDAKIIKSVFVVVYPGGGGSNVITNKLNKICESFQVAKYTFPENNMVFQEKLRQIETELVETRNVHILIYILQLKPTLMISKEFIKTPIVHKLEELKLFLVKEKYLYTQLNYLRVQGSVLYGSIWLPQGADIKVDQALREVQTNYEGLPTGQLQISPPEGTRPPPTYFETNEITWGFQEIVNTYGMPRYKEINPGLFTVMTFPFLFGVMFADIGHGFCLLLLGIYLCVYNKEIKESDSLMKHALIVRHMVLMMGFWAFYNGWIYNDFMSVPINLFGSCYEPGTVDDPIHKDEQVWVQKDESCVYPFGIDPVWMCVPNELTFMNSYKMKLAVIIGVIHMTFGIILKGINAIYFKNWIDFIFEFIPQIIFFTCTFGWMDFLIIYKWFVNWTGKTDQAPSVITLMINMILAPAKTVDPPLWGDGQSEASTQTAMLLIALFCIPIILLPKPLILNSQNKKHQAQGPNGLADEKKELYQKINEDSEGTQENSEIHTEQSGGGGHHEEFGDIFVHQVIETIEFVLGSISNTASYLRLWALSLAHGQLAEVFFQMCLNGGYSYAINFQLLIGYTIFSMATFGVLMMMDVMECFLHALRLHWVEFQNKFFKADGYAFEKCSYAKVMQDNAVPKEE
ncbi:unnamed protein product (macronuclear) [Paramecium tetraurelia]|uniref:V-type proton ATPase subunit a n=1 Tax=Paramecium tetraurelia TaxID=5888 RepID=A0CXP3_PARTE|nr:uncharacterized protein GSPATT00011192001 [Paramecium tetraurelia]CAK75560.1 unnamed protein product [Paramecium tetraurelia]|eukprot:XP_001442957.1 hypothetical protein (macronuclear) [Paramecium tetraurelia strain d4-2]